MGVEELMRILTQPRWVSNPLGMCWYVVQTLGEGTNFASQQVTPTSRILWNTLTFGGCAPSQDAIARWKSGSQPCSHPVMMFLHCWRDGAYLCLYWIKCLPLLVQSLIKHRWQPRHVKLQQRLTLRWEIPNEMGIKMENHQRTTNGGSSHES